jgi:hypothetical protein
MSRDRRRDALFAFSELQSSMPVGDRGGRPVGGCTHSQYRQGIFANNFSEKLVEPVLVLA